MFPRFTFPRFPSSLLPALLVFAAVPVTSAEPAVPMVPAETRETHDARMGWWREARFGMFIHWGLYAEPAGSWNDRPTPGAGEWIMENLKIPVASYTPLTGKFNPGKFHADEWVSVAKNAGMKYIVITAKHHEGFAMFKSAASPFNIVDATPFKRDPLRELADACRRQNLPLGFYYSQDQDWTAPGGGAMHGHWDPAQDGDFAAYFHAKALPQIKELLTNYAPYPAVVWFDTPSKNMTPELAGEVVTLLNEHPNLIWNNRLGGGFKGDTNTPEQTIPAEGFPGRDWETCMTINDTWGYKASDTRFKSVDTLLRNLIDIASKGGNYLLNVGPTAEGVMPAPEVERLTQIGRWLQVNGEAVYGCGPTIFGKSSALVQEKGADGTSTFAPTTEWRCTSRPGRLYISLFKWPDGPFRLPPLRDKVTRAYGLADPGRQPLAVVQDAEGVTLTLPAQAPDPVASVLVLETVPPGR